MFGKGSKSWLINDCGPNIFLEIEKTTKRSGKRSTKFTRALRVMIRQMIHITRNVLKIAAGRYKSSGAKSILNLAFVVTFY